MTEEIKAEQPEVEEVKDVIPEKPKTVEELFAVQLVNQQYALFGFAEHLQALAAEVDQLRLEMNSLLEGVEEAEEQLGES